MESRSKISSVLGPRLIIKNHSYLCIFIYLLNAVFVYFVCITICLFKQGYQGAFVYLSIYLSIMCASKMVRISCYWHYIPYLSIPLYIADPNSFRGTHCIYLFIHIHITKKNRINSCLDPPADPYFQ